jgi:hypothetical protein
LRKDRRGRAELAVGRSLALSELAGLDRRAWR